MTPQEFIAATFAVLLQTAPIQAETCIASQYWLPQKTASGERWSTTKLVVAHRTLPFGTCLRVYTGGKSALVRVNDRGPFRPDRCLDLAPGAAMALGMWRERPSERGLARVYFHRESCQ